MRDIRRLCIFSGLVGFLFVAMGAGSARGQEPAPGYPSSSAPGEVASPPEPVPSLPEPLPVEPRLEPARLAQEPEAPVDTRYGRAHSMHLGLSFGLGSASGSTQYAGGASFGYFVVTGVAPGIDVDVSGGSGVLTTTATTATLRVVPIRSDNIAIFLIGRAGRLFISDHADNWVAGGGGGVVVPVGRRAGLVVSYEMLKLWPSRNCSNLANGCRMDSFGLGLVIGL